MTKAKPIRITIRGAHATGTDAPAVDDLLSQVRDFVEVLVGVERAIVEGSQPALIWRVTDASRNSPLAIELTPYALDPAVDVAAHIDKIERATAIGLSALQHGEVRPPYFTDDVLPRARALHDRVMNGLAETAVSFPREISDAPLVINRGAAMVVQNAARDLADNHQVRYRELGSIEGFVSRVELDGHKRPIMRLRARLSGAYVKAIGKGAAFHKIERLRLSDVWAGLRVRVYGTIFYKALGLVDYIEADDVEVLDQEKLPGIDDIIDPEFTGGLSTEDFLAEIRRDD